MASGRTNKGRFRELGWIYRAVTKPTVFYVALLDQTTAPTVDTNTMADVTEIPAGNGYVSGGISLTPGATDFDVLTEDDTSDIAFVQIKDLVWTASGGPIPSSGTGARWAVLTDDNVTVSAREIFAWWDLVSNRTVSSGQPLTLQNSELRDTV